MKYKDFYLDENFRMNIDKSRLFKSDVLAFIKYVIDNGYIESYNQKLTTTDYKLDDWAESFADHFMNEIIEYMETVNKQGDRNL
jgi:hypothetical protein